MDYLQIEFENVQRAESEILIALLADAGFESFEEEDKMLKAFIKEKDFKENSLFEIMQFIPSGFRKSVIPAENWNVKWEKSFEPIIINDFAAVRAAFHPPISKVAHEIIITPKMSFGTGHHATTHLMIEQMAGMDFKNKRVLDFGTGTGILSILAEKMGASAIDAVDNDDWSIENAKENITANKCSRIEIQKTQSITAGKAYDIILANINLNVIVENIRAISLACTTNSGILFSGFLKQDEALLIKSFSISGMVHHTTIQKGEWICVFAEMN